MLVGIYRSAVILALALVFYAADFWLMRRFDPLRAQGSSRSWSYTALAALAAVILIAQPVILPGLGLRIAAPWGWIAQTAGLLLMTGGLALHWWARVHLGQFYGEREEVQQGQFLVQGGPYAHIRHPIYSSYFAIALGLVLFNPALLTLLMAIYAFVDFSLAVRREEQLLAEQLPGYVGYMCRTSRFLPGFHKRSLTQEESNRGP